MSGQVTHGSLFGKINRHQVKHVVEDHKNMPHDTHECAAEYVHVHLQAARLESLQTVLAGGSVPSLVTIE
jgi:hypothetical protein